MDALLAPAWVIALATAAYMGAMAVVKIRNGNGTNGEAREQTRALQAVTITLTELTAQLQHLPTREELKDIAAENRHEFRNALQVTQGVITERVDRSEHNLTRLIERTAP